MFETALTFAGSRDFNIGDLPAPVGGLGPQTVNSGLLDPVLLVSYGLIVDPRKGQFLALTHHLYVPSGNYDKFSQINFSAPDMYTWVPQLTYAGRLPQTGPVSIWLDVIANASIHSTGSSPLALAPGVQFDRLTQSNSYDLKAFLRYEFMPLGQLALGIERSWGGNQEASGGALEAIFGGPTSFGRDDFTKGHLQLAFRSRETSRWQPTSRMIFNEKAASEKTSWQKFASRSFSHPLVRDIVTPSASVPPSSERSARVVFQGASHCLGCPAGSRRGRNGRRPSAGLAGEHC